MDPPRFLVAETAPVLEVALALRREVFVVEQGVPPELEVDAYDHLEGQALHVVAYRADRPVAAGRLRPFGDDSAKLERIAVIASERGRGTGRALTRYFEDIARSRGVVQLKLHAQAGARGFYEKLGYVVEGEPFLEAGIPHVVMSKLLGSR